MKLFRARSQSEIEAVLAQLDAPAPPFVRVYRGQPRRHFIDAAASQDALVPRSLRSRIDPDPHWLGAVKRLAKYLQSRAPRGAVLSKSRGLAQVLAAALLQHYGPGSAFLDVTRDVSVALWFAAHEWREGRGPSRVYSDEHGGRIDLNITACWYEPIRHEPSVLYVFDAHPWFPSAALEHGQLIDLLDPLYGLGNALGDDNRLVRQGAALLCGARLAGFASTTTDGALTGTLNSVLDAFLGDEPSKANLLDRCVAIVELEPGFVSDQRGTLDLFPQPTQDVIYRTLLEVPCTPHDLFFETEVHRWDTVDKTIDIPEYYSQKPPLVEPASEATWPGYYDQLKSFAACDRSVPPMLFIADLRGRTAEFRSVELNQKRFDLDTALAIWLPSAHWWLIPNPASPHWDTAALGRVPATIGDVNLDNVCVELSALDLWEPGSSQSNGRVRAVWMVRDGNQYLATVFRQDATEGTWRYSIPIAFDSSGGRFQVLKGDPTERLVLEALHGLFLVLDLVLHMVPDRMVTVEIPVDGGAPITYSRRTMRVELSGWGEYRIPHFRNRVAFSPGVQFFEDDRTK